MTATADPIIVPAALAREVGVSVQAIHKWTRAGHIPTAERGAIPLLAAMRGIVRAVQAEAAATEPYEVKAPAVPEGAILLADLAPILDRIAVKFDVALAEAVGAVDAEVSRLHRPPVSAASAWQARQAEALRTSLYAARRRAAGLPPAALGLVAEWEARK